MFEELFSEQEDLLATHHPKIMKAKKQEIDEERIQKIDQLLETVEDMDERSIIRAVISIVPEFSPELKEKPELKENSMLRSLRKKDEANNLTSGIDTRSFSHSKN